MTADRARAVAFNAIQPALAKTGDWVALRARMNVAVDVLAALEEAGFVVVTRAELGVFGNFHTTTDTKDTDV
ncbi:hypothetical protein ACWEN6_13740 [Sphaerisporangium sp. NPDC004334]